MHRSPRLARLALAVVLTAALLTPAALAAPAATRTDDGPVVSWWSLLTETIARVLAGDALGPGWEPWGVDGDGGGDALTTDGGTTGQQEDPVVGDDNALGPGWEPWG